LEDPRQRRGFGFFDSSERLTLQKPLASTSPLSLRRTAHLPLPATLTVKDLPREAFLLETPGKYLKGFQS